jgi:hypothetical protein
MHARSAKAIRPQILKYRHMKGLLFLNQYQLHPGIALLFMDTTILKEIAKGKAQVG